MCKKQNSVSHSSTESEIISLDAGLRLDGRPALNLWDLIVAVLLGNTYQNNQEQWDPYQSPTRKKSHGKIDDLYNVDSISSNVHSSHKEALLYIFENNEAVIKMMIMGRSPTMRHVWRTHIVDLYWLFDRINLVPKIQIKYIVTKNQLADILTKGNFTRDEWNHLLCLFNISHFSSINSVEAMSKRTQEDEGEERVTAKLKPMMNLVSRYSVKDPNVLASTASESLEKTKSESQNVPLSSLNVQQTSTGRPVLIASSSTYSEWNIDNKWSSQEEIWWHVENEYGETRRWQVCHRWWYRLWHRHRIEPFSKVTMILEQGEWSIAKDVGPSSRRCNARHRQTFYDLVNVFVFDIGSICIHGKELLRNFTFHQNYRRWAHLNADVRHLKKLIVEQPDEIFGSDSN